MISNNVRTTKDRICEHRPIYIFQVASVQLLALNEHQIHIRKQSFYQYNSLKIKWKTSLFTKM